jgi:hypothetical protein
VVQAVVTKVLTRKWLEPFATRPARLGGNNLVIF